MELQFNFAPKDYVGSDALKRDVTYGQSELVNAQQVNNEDQSPAR